MVEGVDFAHRAGVFLNVERGALIDGDALRGESGALIADQPRTEIAAVLFALAAHDRVLGLHLGDRGIYIPRPLAYICLLYIAHRRADARAHSSNGGGCGH